MAVVSYDDHSSNTVRSDRDVIATGTAGAQVENFYAAKSTWVEADPVGAPGVFTPPLVAGQVTWVIA